MTISTTLTVSIDTTDLAAAAQQLRILADTLDPQNANEAAPKSAAGVGIAGQKIPMKPVEVAEEEKAPAKTVEEKKAKKADKDEPELDYEQVKNATLNFVKAKGRDAATAVLKGFEVAKATELAEDQWPAYLAELEKASS